MFDLIIIGAGPAGLSAAVYASRYGINCVVVGGIIGGLAGETHEIGNWLGTEKISGFEFAQNAQKHVQSLGVEILQLLAVGVEKKSDLFAVTLSDGKIIEVKAVLLATGTKHRHLNIPGEHELAGRGVSYCATCDGFFYRGKTVAVIGGNDSSAAAAVSLSNIAAQVYIIYRGDKLRAENFWLESIVKNEKIKVIYNSNVLEIHGGTKVESVKLDHEHQGSDILNVDGVFIEIGSDPSVDLANSLKLDLDNDGYIKVGEDQGTSVPGVWAAGDTTTGSNKFKQIVTAAAEGAIAIKNILKYLRQ